jgi:monothiol glutaredoxin
MSDDLRNRIKEIIETEDVVLFMKGTPQWAMCGNSMRALEALRAAEAPIAAVDILPNPEYRKELSALSGWPTIPQVFVRGELVGGADICEELLASGELGETLRTKLGDEGLTGEERVVDVLAPAAS